MMKQDRFLLFILIGIAILSVIAIAVFLGRGDQLAYDEEETPSGVVHNFVVAIYRKDYDKAYAYLAEDPNKPTRNAFRQRYQANLYDNSRPGVEILNETIEQEMAYVSISLIYSQSDPFATSYRNTENAQLVRQGGAWKIKQMPYSLWEYQWYQTPVKP